MVLIIRYVRSVCGNRMCGEVNALGSYVPQLEAATLVYSGQLLWKVFYPYKGKVGSGQHRGGTVGAGSGYKCGCVKETLLFGGSGEDCEDKGYIRCDFDHCRPGLERRLSIVGVFFGVTVNMPEQQWG